FPTPCPTRPGRLGALDASDMPANAAADRSVPALTSDTVVRTSTCPARAAGRGTSSTRGALRPSRITEFISRCARFPWAELRPSILEESFPASLDRDGGAPPQQRASKPA